MIALLLCLLAQLSVTEHLPLTVSPLSIHFGRCNIGFLTARNISLTNRVDRELYVAADYSLRAPFQPSITQTQSILLEPGDSYELPVLFLPHAEGNVSSSISLYVYSLSSAIPGDVVTVNVSGEGVESPYQLTPFVGIRWPTSLVFSPSINIYNPYSSELRVKEMYASGGSVNLVPPFEEPHSWTIPPYESKSVMRLNLYSDRPSQHLSYVTIRLDVRDHPDIRLPIDVRMVSTGEVFPLPRLIDFGKFTRYSPTKVVSIYLLSTLNCTTKLFSVSITDSILHDNGITVTLHKDTVYARQGMFQKIADVTIDPELLPEFADQSLTEHTGNVSIKFNSRKVGTINIPFTARVYSGSLTLSGFQDGFYSGSLAPRQQVKSMSLTNYYNVPIAVKNVDLTHFTKDFLIENLRVPFVIQPQEKLPLADFSLRRQGSRLEGEFDLGIETNLTQAHTFTVSVYSGDLDITVDKQPLNVLNFEVLGYNQTRYKLLEMRNKNPVPVQLHYYFTNVPFAEVYYSNVWRAGRESMIKYHKEDVIQTQMLTLDPGDFVQINVTLTTPAMRHNVSGFFIVETNFDIIQLPLTFRTLEGHLLMPHLDYKELFPGKTHHLTLMITNTFNESFPLEKVMLSPSKLVSLVRTERSVTLKPLQSNSVGKIRFTPERDSQYSYLLTEDSKKQVEYFKGCRLNFDQVDYELKLYKHLKGKYNALRKVGKHRFTVEGAIKSSFSDNSPINVDLSLVWPSLVDNHTDFPTTHVREDSVSEVSLHNPSLHPLHLELFFINHYPHSRALVDILGMRKEVINVDNAFSLDDPSTGLLGWLRYGSELSRNLHSVVLEPGERRKVGVRFSPQFIGPHKSILVIRNNLTLFEPILYSTHAAKGDLVFEKKSSLVLSMPESLLSECHYSEEGTVEPGFFNVNRTFTLKNVGDLSSTIEDIQINGASCAGYGISVVNCGPLTLQPNTAHLLKLNFAPNFHYSYSEFTLTVLPSAGETLSIPIIAKVPATMLSPCLATLKKPIWEVSFRFLLLNGALCAIVVVFVQSYLFFSTPVVISTAGLAPAPTITATAVGKSEQASGGKSKKKGKSEQVQQPQPQPQQPQQPVVVSAKQRKKKNKESAAAAAAAAAAAVVSVVPEPSKVAPVPVKVTISPKVAKKKPAAPKPDPPKPELVRVEPSKPEKMTSIVKPRIKEQQPSVTPPPLKKPKDVGVVKPEMRVPPPPVVEAPRKLVHNPKSLPTKGSPHPPPPAPPTLEYRLSERLQSEAEKPEIAERFDAAVLEEKRLRHGHQAKFMNPWTAPSTQPIHPPPPPAQQPPVQQQLQQQLQQPKYPTLFNPLASVDDWFAPNAPFSEFSEFSEFALLPSSRQTSRLQALFREQPLSTPPTSSSTSLSSDHLLRQQLPGYSGGGGGGGGGGEDIWTPIMFDQGLDGNSWKTE